VGAFPAARVTDLHTCPMVTGIVPHVGGPILPPCSPTVLVGMLPVARLGDMATCVGPPDVIAMGASTVLTNGLPTVRLMDLTVHGGVITAPGEPTVLIGDPAFGLPLNIKIDGPPDFENKTIRDLYELSTTPSGADLIGKLGAAGEPVTIIPCPDPNNSFCSPDSQIKALFGSPTGSVIQYNPDIQLTVFDSSGTRVAEPPAVVLGHEMCHALANSDGTHKYGTDPTPPASQPKIEEEEAQAIGTGSHTGGSPSENSIRSDLGLPPRDNHFGDSVKPGDPTGPKRPGDP
jgi:uncharacterized Zn-binding protein involved in type VI secretion